ncbi:MAG TPA: hypothetical protein VIY86_08865 [Pirellulaceae bacterium]
MTNDPDVLISASRNDVRQWGWDGIQLAERIFALRQETIPTLPAQASASPSQFAPVYMDHPDTWRILVTSDHQLVGCWHFLSLRKESFDLGLAGKLNVCDVHSDILRAMEEPGWYDIYVLTYILGSAFRLSESSLGFARGMFDVLLDLAQRGIFIRGLAANFISAHGLGIARALGMEMKCPHEVQGSVYYKPLPEMLRELQFSDRRGSFVGQLREYYPTDGTDVEVPRPS